MEALKHITKVTLSTPSTWTKKETARFKMEHIKAVNNIIDYYNKRRK